MYDITIIPGDGIGPEVMEVALGLLDVLNVQFNFTEAHAGCECYKRTGTTIPQETIQTARKTDATLFGAVTSVPNQKSGIIALRKALDLYANVRPVKSYPGINSIHRDLNMVIIRENTEGLYSGIESETPDGATALRVVTEKASERICRFAFQYVERTGRTKVTAVHKANVLKLSDGVFKNKFYEVSKQYPGVEVDDKCVDAVAMLMVTKPQIFDVIVTTNLYGDILSDEGAGLVGGLGLTPSANIGKNNGLFEPVHGSGPDIAGQGIANPSAMILSTVMMLNFLKETEEARRLETALAEVLSEGKKVTPDLGGKSKTTEMAGEIREKLRLN